MELIIYDHQIFAVNRNKAENFSDSLVYKTEDGLHQIDFEECEKISGNNTQQAKVVALVKETLKRDIFFCLPMEYKQKLFSGRLLFFRSQNFLLCGTRKQRFLQLQKLLMQTKYTTYDLT